MNPGAYWGENKDYLFIRMRVAISNAVAGTFHDSHWIYIDRVGFTNGTAQGGMPDYALVWDSKSGDVSKHGLEMQTGTNLSATTYWSQMSLADIDGSMGGKTAPPDINTNGNGFIRTVDMQATTNFGFTTFIDFAVSWSYLSSNTVLGRGQSWRLQFGDRNDANDHNFPQDDIAGGASAGSVVTNSWSDPAGITSAEPTLHATNMTFASVGTTNMTVYWTAGSGSNRIVVASTNPVTWAPTDGTSYVANANFSLATDQGSGNKVVYDGSGTNVTVIGLSPAIVYYFTVYEYNGSNATANYFTIGPLSSNQQTLVTLQIVSTRGTATPATGMYAYVSGSVLTNSVAGATVGSTQYVSTGWSMTGNLPVSGTDTSLVMTLTNNAVLTWQWATNYWLTLGTTGSGTLDRTSGWQGHGSNVTVTATPSVGYHFAGWTGDVTGDTNALSMTVTMGGPRTLNGNFEQDQADIAVSKAVNRWHPGTNETIWYTVTVSNGGPSAASGVEVTDYWPTDKVTFVSALASQGAYDGTTGVWQVGSLAVLESASLVLTGQMAVATSGVFAVNTATLTHLDQIDTNAANNSGSVGVLTLAQVARFEAFGEAGKVVVEWETASELDTAGFRLYRADVDGTPVPVTDGLLPGLLTAPQGGVYRLVDFGAVAGGTYAYTLEEVESHGGRISHGPYTVTVQPRTLGKGSQVVDSYSRQAHALTASSGGPVTTMASGSAAAGDEVAVGDRVKIRVRESGLYYVAATDIGLRLGTSGAAVSELIAGNRVRLSCQGREVAWLPGRDGLCFYGEPLRDSIYSIENVYWLQTNASGLAMAACTGPDPVPASASGTLTDTAHVESNQYAVTALFDSPSDDFWIWDFVTAGTAGADRKTFPFTLKGYSPVEGAASIRVRLKGATESGKHPEHHVLIKLNGTLIAEQRFDGLAECDVSVPVSNLLLSGGTNHIELAAVLDAGVPYSLLCLDSIDVSFQREARAASDRILMAAPSTDTVAIDGFTSPDVHVLDVTDPWLPVVLASTRSDLSANGYRVSFRPASAGSRCLLSAPAGILAPLSVEGVTLQGLKSPANRADYVAIASASLRQGTEGLLDYRASMGMQARSVEVDRIYDEFNYGIVDPRAIQAFLGYAYRTWEKRPRYIVLVGQGTYDYQNHAGYGQCLVPPLMVRTESGLFASDMALADVNGDGLPEMSVGRLPVLTAAELAGVVDKIAAYEAGGAWKDRVELVADNPDRGGDFGADSDALLRLIGAERRVDRAYLADRGLQGTKSAVCAAMNEGRRVVNYIGHAGMDRLASEGIFTTADVAGLRNGANAPLVLAMTCILNRYDIPGYDSLGESLVRSSVGAVAVVAPIAGAFNAESRVLDRELTARLCGNAAPRVGDALAAALRQGAAQGWTRGVMQTYVLMGDPATAAGEPRWTPAGGPDERDGLPVSYEEWLGLSLAPVEMTSGMVAEDADPDGDGISNGLEYRLALDPRDGRPEKGFKLVAARSGTQGASGTFDFTLHLRKTVVRTPSLSVEVCDDLAAPQWRHVEHTIVSRRDEGMGLEALAVSLSETAGVRNILFARVRVAE